ncbi:hypothetical protein PUR61_03395 [Streptomyces sp. BE20]|uniref:hypothetical protein n=1 Tax=Streptomyces sp. BE20 TaxID=3002525 RepID=UPI002E795F5B|nr:hypothetical protein [Streptomyces sp. BE20]MEE1821248.1 hypothetical protein [Streptomyces sp. BE20]
MTNADPVQDRIDELETEQDLAKALQSRALRLAVTFHHRAQAAAAELDDFINHLERDGR